MRRTLAEIRAVIFEGTPAADALSRRVRAAIYLGRLGVRILKQWARDKCPQQAAALGFQTALSLVPIFAIAFTIPRKIGAGDSANRLSEFLSERVFPTMGDITAQLEKLADNISVGALGAGSLIVTLVTCYTLYNNVERIFNDIWRVGQRRTLIGKFLTFYAMVTLLPILAGLSLLQSAAAGPTAKLVGPLLIQLAALLLMNKLLPRANVRWGPALIGALVTGVALELLKFGFVTYAKGILLKNYTGVYGSLGLIPLLLIWIWISWLLVLLGAEIAHATQNLRLLEAEERRRRGEEPINALVAAQLLAAVAAEHERGGHGVTGEKLATDFALTADVVERIFERLKARRLVAEVHGDMNGFIPGRPATAITMNDVLSAFRSTDLETAQGATSPALQALITDLEQARQQRIAGLTIADLVPREAVPRKIG